MSRGTLRIYLGAAPGVGKTYAMLGEGRRRAGRGTDLVVGIVETHGRAQTEGQLSDLEVVPIGGEHIQAIDEPYIAKVGAHMSEAINRIEAEEKQAK